MIMLNLLPRPETPLIKVIFHYFCVKSVALRTGRCYNIRCYVFIRASTRKIKEEIKCP